MQRETLYLSWCKADGIPIIPFPFLPLFCFKLTMKMMEAWLAFALIFSVGNIQMEPSKPCSTMVDKRLGMPTEEYVSRIKTAPYFTIPSPRPTEQKSAQNIPRVFVSLTSFFIQFWHVSHEIRIKRALALLVSVKANLFFANKSQSLCYFSCTRWESFLHCFAFEQMSCLKIFKWCPIILQSILLLTPKQQQES